MMMASKKPVAKANVKGPVAKKAPVAKKPFTKGAVKPTAAKKPVAKKPVKKYVKPARTVQAQWDRKPPKKGAVSSLGRAPKPSKFAYGLPVSRSHTRAAACTSPRPHVSRGGKAHTADHRMTMEKETQRLI